ncbi:hypothetical protein YK48G_17200 [Lentilactobacillus fungorum]|uniref:Sigma-70 family RNA polymerase sigma factor n=1 Tax=Lentilactobacillus fungorum TaxID=2201250 RepID=A0ABQ3W0D7_9LACO|nr:hypothetical protein [Lentilactobacillus fungorum]GHP14295.1 hypothetical protein YK48G_17200 [Lentilactobacillus fungorum]
MKEFKPIYEMNWTSRQVMFFLRKWKHYDTHLNDLNEVEIKQVRALYYRLSYLTDPQRELLAEKYYVDHPQDMLPDTELANRHHMTVTHYRQYRLAIIERLRKKRDQPANQFNKLAELKKLFPEMFE